MAAMDVGQAWHVLALLWAMYLLVNTNMWHSTERKGKMEVQLFGRLLHLPMVVPLFGHCVL